MRSVADEASQGGRGTWKGLQQHTKEFSFDAIGDREPQISSQKGREDQASLKDHAGHNVKGRRETVGAGRAARGLLVSTVPVPSRFMGS